MQTNVTLGVSQKGRNGLFFVKFIHMVYLLYFLGHPEQVIWRQVDARCASSIHSGDRSGVRGMGGSQVAQIVSQRVESGRDKDEFRVESLV